MDPQILPFYLVARAVAVVAAVLVVGLVVWAVARHYVRRLRRRRAGERAHRRRYRPDGQPYPPVGMGICQECQQAGNEVFHLPSGKRLCKDCYARSEGLDTDDDARSRK